MSSDPAMYAEPQRYPAVVTDRWGRFETTLVNDGQNFIGTMACFRGAKDAYRAVNSKRDLFRVSPQRSGFVQETFCCPQFEQRQPGAGYRGWPSESAPPP